MLVLRRLFCSAIGLLSLGAGAALADTTLVKSGNWFDAANWKPAVPTAADVVTIGGGNTVTISKAGAVAKNVNIADANGDGTLVIAEEGELTVAADSVVGHAAGRVGKLRIEGGSFLAGEANLLAIGKGKDATGVVELIDGQLQPGKNVIVGAGGTGTLKIDGGTYRSKQDLHVGHGDTGVGTVLLTGSWEGHGHRTITIGQNGKGTLQLVGAAPIAPARASLNLGPNSTVIFELDEKSAATLKNGINGDLTLGGTLIVRKREGAGGLPPYVDLVANASKAELKKEITGDFASVEITKDFEPLDRSEARRVRVRSRGENAVVVSPEKRQKMTYGMDFERMWHFKDEGKPVNLDELAQWSVVQCPVDYVRIAINPGAELKEGEIKWKEYDHQVQMMAAIQKVRPDIKWFASPRPLQNEQKGAPFTPFPLWISVWNNPLLEDKDKPRTFAKFEAEKAAAYYVRFLRFMQEKGFKMTYLDAINEATAHLQPEGIAVMIDGIRKEMGKDMPLVIAPSAHNWGEGTRWIRRAKEIGRTDFWDISAVHNTRAWGRLEDFVTESRALNKDVWNTELHGFDGPGQGGSTRPAEINSKIIFTHVRAGVGGLNDWLSLGNEKKTHKMFRNIDGKLVVMRPFYIWQHLVLNTQGGSYLDSTFPGALESSMAFVNEAKGTVTLYVLNSREETVKGLKLDLSKVGKPVTPVSVKWWNASTEDPGSETNLGQSAGATLTYDIEGKTLYAFTFKI